MLASRTLCGRLFRPKLLQFRACSVRDGVASDVSAIKPENLVYEGPMTGVMRRVKYFSFTTSGMGFALQAVVLNRSLQAGEMSWKLVAASIIGTSIIMTPLLLNLLTKRYVTELHFDPNSKLFTASTLSFFNRRQQTSFRASDVIIPTVDWPFTTFVVRDKPYLVDPTRFSKPTAYHHLMGFDRPLEEELKFAHEEDALVPPSAATGHQGRASAGKTNDKTSKSPTKVKANSQP